nr:hypothetical protein CJLB15_00090 [Campylobacter phage CJLB-15]
MILGLILLGFPTSIFKLSTPKIYFPCMISLWIFMDLNLILTIYHT